jgi:hypothetical protein
MAVDCEERELDGDNFDAIEEGLNQRPRTSPRARQKTKCRGTTGNCDVDVEIAISVRVVEQPPLRYPSIPDSKLVMCTLSLWKNPWTLLDECREDESYRIVRRRVPSVIDVINHALTITEQPFCHRQPFCNSVNSASILL